MDLPVDVATLVRDIWNHGSIFLRLAYLAQVLAIGLACLRRFRSLSNSVERLLLWCLCMPVLWAMLEAALTTVFLVNWAPRPSGWTHVLAQNFFAIGTALVLNVVATTIGGLRALHGLPAGGVVAGVLAIGADAYLVMITAR